MFTSLRFRLWLTYVLLVGVVLLIAGLAVGIFVLRNPLQDRREIQRLRLVSNLIAQRSQLFNLGSASRSPRLQELVSRADTLSSARVAIFSASGELVVDSRSESDAPLPEWSFFANRRSGAVPIFRDPSGRQWIYVQTSLEGGSRLLVTEPRPRISVLSVLKDDFLSPFLRGALLALALSVILAIWIAQWISAPLQRLEKATRMVTNDDFQKVTLEGPREVQAVARSFNQMVESVRTSRQSQRDFIANISHDLRTPLTSVQGFAQAILDGTASDSAGIRQSAQVIFDEAARMKRMVMELLELARMEAGTLGFERQRVDIGALLRDVLEKFTPQAHLAQVELHLDQLIEGEKLPEITADDDRLTQVFSNLIDNALKFVPPGGTISVTARPVDGWLEVQVADTGPGIPPDELERIFERFYQTDKARSGGNQRGMGLGLAITREIVLAHGGTISVHNRSELELQSTPGAEVQSSVTGSVFIVRLPIISRVDESPALKQKRLPAHSDFGPDKPQ
jgi:two-component system OmpR family sensor kinase